MNKVTLFIIFLLALSIAGCLPLQQAASDGDTKAVIALLDSGKYGINERYSNWTPLLHASYHGRVDTVRLLLDRGADITAAHSGRTALTLAAINGHANVARLLIERGADIDAAMAGLNTFSSAQAKPGITLLERLAVKPDTGGQTLSAKSATRSQPLLSVKTDIDEIPAIMTEPRSSAFAVVIGIENYRGLPKSDYSGNDAALVKSYLKALGFQERNIDFITNDKATKTDIEKSLEAWLPNRATKDSLIIVYFSGHGAPEPATGEAYMVPYDGDPNYLSVTGYSLKRLYERLGKLEAREIIVVLDSCFSGAGGRSVLAKGTRPLVMMAAAEAPPAHMAVLTATQRSQISTSSPDKGHGVFTYYFLKALKDGKKNIAEIYDYLKPLVEDEAKAMNVQQTPSLSPDATQLKGRFVLMR